MAEIHVSNGRFGLSFLDAMSKARVGDVLVLGEGDYTVGSIYLTSLRIVGVGDPRKIILRGQLDVRGTSQISNLTICAPHFYNAIYINTPGARVDLEGSAVYGEPTLKYPAIYNSGGTVVMRRSTVYYSKASAGVLVEENGELHAFDSGVACLHIIGSRAVLTNVSAYSIRCSERGRIEAHGRLDMIPDEEQRALVIESESVCSVAWLRVMGGPWEGLCDESVLRLDRVEIPEKHTFRVVKEGHAFVETSSPAVTVEDSAEGAPARVEPAAIPASGAHAPAPVVTAAGSADKAEEGGDREDPLAEIMSLPGLVTVKEQVQAFTRMVQFNQLREKQGFKSTGLTMHSMFLGNPGTGKTTVARLLGKALFRAGAIERDVFVEVGRRDLVGENLGASANMTQKVLERARGGVLFIDEAYSLYQNNNNEFGQEAVETLLTFMENNRDDIVVILAGYTDRMQDFLRMNQGLKSRVPNRFDFEDYLPAEIADIGYREVLRADYTVNEALYRRVVASMYRRTTDQSNGRWVRNFNESLFREMARRVLDDHARNPGGLVDMSAQHISDEDVYNLVGGDSERKGEKIEILIEQLDGLVGLAPVKAWVRDLIDEARANRELAEIQSGLDKPTYHMVFTGNPGTGKTTVAKIIAQLFYNLGILENSTVKEVDRSSLVGSWIGHTEANTTKAIDEAMGGVLFVDEAYQLYVEDSRDDFGKQAIETFMTRLENDRDKFVAIFAGYTANMDHFLSVNPGLRSRIPYTIEFPDYSPEEVGGIVVRSLAKTWTFDDAVVTETAAKVYAALAQQDKSNGRWARNFAQLIEKRQKKWIVEHGLSGAAAMVISAEVVEAVRQVSSLKDDAAGTSAER